MTELKHRILYLFPGPTHTLQSPDLKDRFAALSEDFEGEVYSWTERPDCAETQLSSFHFRAFVSPKTKSLRLRQAIYVLRQVHNSSKQRRFDVVICYDPIFSGIVGCVIKLIWGYKLILELNNSDIPKAIKMQSGNKVLGILKAAVYQLIIWMTSNYADRLKVLSPELKKYVPQKYHKKISVFHDYSATHFFDDKPKRRDKYLLFVGYPFYRKGIDVLVKAFESIAERFPEFELWLVGHQLEEEAKKSIGNWHKRIKFIRPVLYKDIVPYFLNCYCFVLASREEGLPRVLIEAMACEKPIIGTNVGGVTDLIDGNGYLVPSENQFALAEALTNIMMDENRAQEMGKRSRVILEEKFSSEIYQKCFYAMISNLLKHTEE